MRNALKISAAVLILCLAVLLGKGQSAGNTPAVATTEPVKKVSMGRPVLSEKEYAALAADLRAKYSKPPAQWPKANVDPSVEFHELGRLPKMVYPPTNPFSKQKQSLGQQLFFDPRLSGSSEIACASCHDPDLAWADGRTVPFGHARHRLRRNAPSVLFSGYATSLFWDGRAATLEDQVKMPLQAHNEMDGDAVVVVGRLNDIPEYRQQFKEVFGADQVTIDDVAKAIATFERSLSDDAGRSPFDKFLAGRTKALSDSAVRGLDLFRTTARCINCHSGPMLSDGGFHNLGLSYYGHELEDRGRYNVTLDPKDMGRFRTPTLRNVLRTRPYMHNGIFELEGIISSYNSGMPTLARTAAQKDDPLFPIKDPLLKPLGLNSQEKEDLIAFLTSLSESPRRMRPPPLPGMDDDGVEIRPRKAATKPADPSTRMDR